MSDKLSDSTYEQTAEVDAVNMDSSEIMESGITTDTQNNTSFEEPTKQKKSRARLSDEDGVFNKRQTNILSMRKKEGKSNGEDGGNRQLQCFQYDIANKHVEKKETSLRNDFTTLQAELDELIQLGNNNRKEKNQEIFKMQTGVW